MSDHDEHRTVLSFPDPLPEPDGTCYLCGRPCASGLHSDCVAKEEIAWERRHREDQQ